MSTNTKPITPIRTEEDFRAALAEIESLWQAAPGTAEFDRLDVLSTLAEKYEREHHAIEPPDVVEAIRFRMSQQGIKTPADLAERLGLARSRLSEILTRRRRVSMTQAVKLHAWGISSDVLLRGREAASIKKPPAKTKRRTKTKRRASSPRPAVR